MSHVEHVKILRLSTLYQYSMCRVFGWRREHSTTTWSNTRVASFPTQNVPLGQQASAPLFTATGPAGCRIIRSIARANTSRRVDHCPVLQFSPADTASKCNRALQIWVGLEDRPPTRLKIGGGLPSALIISRTPPVWSSCQWVSKIPLSSSHPTSRITSCGTHASARHSVRSAEAYR